MTSIKTKLALLLAVCLMITSIFPVYAVEAPETEQPAVQEEITETGTAQQEKTQVQEQSDPEEATPDKAVYEKEASDEDIEEASSSEAKETELLTWEKEVDGIIITLTADPGVFPDGAELFAERVEDEKTEEAIEEAVEKERDNTASVASNYKFDIKMLVNGEEVQPDTSNGTVKVGFRLAEKINDCLEVNAYHLKEDAKGELTAETLDTEVKTVEESETENAVVTADEDGALSDGDIENDIKKKVTSIEAETDGFSYYVVEFTYDKLQYVLPGDSSIKLSVILEALAIKGTVENVTVSSPELFSADKDENGVWTVTAHQAFSSTEKMTVTMDDGTKYEIVVTDDATDITTWGGLRAALSGDDGTIKLGGDITAEPGSTTLTVSGTKTLDLNGYVINGKIGDTTNVGSVITVGSGANLTLQDSNSGNKTHKFTVGENLLWTLDETNGPKTVTGGVITGGKGDHAGGVVVEQSSEGKPAGKFIMIGGNIVGNTSSNAGGGVYLKTGAEFKMKGGSIVGNKAGDTKTGGGVGLTSASFTMTGGKITNNVAGNGGGVYSDKGTFKMEGGEIGNNTAKQNYGGGVGIGSGTFDMSGGSIADNTATQNGGGVYVLGSFKMTGGSITNNTATSGGGVHVYKWGEKLGNFKMTGGSIAKNKADNGSGVYNSGTFTMNAGSITDNKSLKSDSGGGGVYNAGTFTMTGGNIKKHNSNKGGGVYNNGTFTMTGGSITENTATNGGGVYYDDNGVKMTVGGDAAITGNNKGGSSSNVFLKAKRTIAIGTGDDAPRSGMSIGVILSVDHNNEGVITSAGAGQYAHYFSADDTDYCIIVTSDSKLKLKKITEGGFYTVTFDTDGGTPENVQQNVEDGAAATQPTPPTKSGYDFAGWYTDSGCTAGNEYDFSTPVTSNFTLYAKWVENPSPDPDPDPDPKPQRTSSSGNTYTLYTGTGNNPVSTGKWTKNADGTWSYSTRYKFTETWGCIADAGKPDSKAWYYFDRNGRMLTGWHKLYWNGAYRWFYFSKTKDANEGKCQLGGITPDGYKVGPDGAWIE